MTVSRVCLIDVAVPMFAESVSEGRLMRWLCEVGADLAPDQVIAEIETDKVVLEIPAPTAGVLVERCFAEGETLLGGQVLARLDTAVMSSEPVVETQESAGPLSEAVADGRREERVPMTLLRERIAQRMLESQSTTASLVTFAEVNMEPVEQLLAAVQAEWTRAHGQPLSGMALVIKAAARALQRHPILNASRQGREIVYHHYVDAGVAVASPRGLVVPVLRDAHLMPLEAVERSLRALAERATEGALALADLTGGTFTISNGGVFGSLMSVPIINPPQSAILGIHASTPRPVAVDGEVVIRSMSYLALSYDHCIVDGREAVLGLAAIKEALENPVRLLMPDAACYMEAQPRNVSVAPEIGQRPGIGADGDEGALHAVLRGSLAGLLEVDAAAIDADAPMASLGLTSLKGVEFAAQASRACGVTIGPTKIYAYPTLREFTSHARSLVAYADTAASVDRAKAPPPVPRPSDRVAIVGMSGRYPGGADLEAFWESLRDGRSAIVEVPPRRWDIDAYHDERPFEPGKMSTRWMGYLEDADLFDPLFFSISPLDAQRMDPQQRLFLQEAYHAFEHAGYAPSRLAGVRCGVYLGLCNNDYALVARAAGHEVADRLGNSNAVAAARIAYHLDLCGPAMTIDTACSSSLVCIHQARLALLAGEIDMAVAGAATLHLAPELFVCWSGSGMLSPDGRCRTFDNGANGFVPGEAVGAVVLKRLDDAVRDGDFIHGVVAASAINQDGRTNGITAPSLMRQSELIGDLYERTGLSADTIDYVEAHGTGTKLGDPVELEALTAAFRRQTQRAAYCAIGSVKTNIGHTVAAAGMAGLHKVLLSMKHRQIPPTLNFAKPNEHFGFAASPFIVNTRLVPWPEPVDRPRRAAVSSFGISGTNAHLVIEDFADVARTCGDCSHRLPVAAPALLSAASYEQLSESAAALAAHLRTEAALDLLDLAYTLQVGRDTFEHRLCVVFETRADLLAALDAFACNQSHDMLHVGFADETRREQRRPALTTPVTDLRAAAAAWVMGAVVDWSAQLAQAPRRRVPLPTYPFARESYWVEGVALRQQNDEVSATLDLGLFEQLLDDALRGESPGSVGVDALDRALS